MFRRVFNLCRAAEPDAVEHDEQYRVEDDWEIIHLPLNDDAPGDTEGEEGKYRWLWCYVLCLLGLGAHLNVSVYLDLGRDAVSTNTFCTSTLYIYCIIYVCKTCMPPDQT